MKTYGFLGCVIPMGVLMISLPNPGPNSPSADQVERQQAQQAFQAGNFKDAYAALRKMAMEKSQPLAKVAADLIDMARLLF